MCVCVCVCVCVRVCVCVCVCVHARRARMCTKGDLAKLVQHGQDSFHLVKGHGLGADALLPALGQELTEAVSHERHRHLRLHPRDVFENDEQLPAQVQKALSPSWHLFMSLSLVLMSLSLVLIP